jgi:hypothetical protein
MSSHWLRGAFMIGLLSLCWTAGAALAAQGRSDSDVITLPFGHQIAFLLKALAHGYDLDHIQEYKTGFRLGIVFNPNDRLSAEAQADVSTVMPSMSYDRPVSGFPIPFANADQLREAIRSNRINVVYICPGNDRNVSLIVQIARELNVLTSTGIEKYVRDGVGLGVHGSPRGRDFKPAFSVNRLTANFHADFLNSLVWKTFR